MFGVLDDGINSCLTERGPDVTLATEVAVDPSLMIGLAERFVTPPPETLAPAQKEVLSVFFALTPKPSHSQSYDVESNHSPSRKNFSPIPVEESCPSGILPGTFKLPSSLIPSIMTPLLMIVVAWVDRDIPRNVLSCTGLLPEGHPSCTNREDWTTEKKSEDKRSSAVSAV